MRDPPLITAIQQDRVDVVKLLLQYNADVNVVGPVAPGSKRFNIPLFHAATLDRFEILKMLLDCKSINIDQVDKDGNPLLQGAIARNSPRAARI